jgi:uncharacterized protein
MDTSVVKTAGATFIAAGLAVAAIFAVGTSQRNDQQGKIVIAASSTQYMELASRYQEELRKFGVDIEVRRTTRVTTNGQTSVRPLEGRITLRALTEDSSGITAGFVKGGLVGSLQGRLASEKQKGRHAEYSKLRSVGRLFHEPVWVFTRGNLPLTTLRDLKGKKIMIGGRDSGSRAVARQLLRANGVVEKETATFIDEDLPSDAGPLLTGTADAAILIAAADTDKIQELLRIRSIRLMDFKEEAEAYVNRFPALSKVVLRQGAVEFDPLIPTDDITLLSTSVALVVRPDMQPALVSLLTSAIIHNPRSGFDKNGDPVLFYKPGEFPSASDPEYEVPEDARIVYRSNELPFMLRTIAPINHRLGLSFGFTSFVSAHAAKLVLLIPLLAVILPLFKAIPAIYVWNIRRRLVYWYRQLKTLERRLESGEMRYDPAAVHAEVDRIDAGVRRVRVPLYYSSELYDLRSHIDLVRQRLLARAGPTLVPRAAAE